MKDKKNKEPKDTLSEEELKLLKRSVDRDRAKRRILSHYDNSDGAKLKRYAKNNKVFAIICAVLAVSLCALLIFVGAFIAKKISDRPNTDDFTLILGDGKYTEKTKYTEKYKDLMRDGVLYVDMYKLARYADLTVTGTKTSVKFTSNDDNYLRFENGSNEAVINGSKVELGGIALINENICHVPYEFLTKAIGDSVKFTFDGDTNTIKIERRVSTTEDRGVYKPLEILFHADAFTVLMGIVPATSDTVFEYAIDVEAFMSSIDPKNADEYLILANKSTPLGEDYEPSDLKKLECETASKALYLRSDAANSLYAMMLEMRAAGIKNVFVTSAYRDYGYQENLWENYVTTHMAEGMTREEAEKAALTYSAKAGTSEHQTGLCIDFMTTSMTELDESFENTEAFRWLSQNAHKYGFILRYPSNKEDTTGYKYEPWHYRFVGRTAATEIHNSSLCLEEYLELN